MVVPSTEMWKEGKKQGEKQGGGIGNQELSWRCVKLKIPITYLRGGDEQAAFYISLERRRQVRARDINLGVISMQMTFKTMTAEQITKGMEMETKTILPWGTQTLQKGSLLCPRNQVNKIFQEGENIQLHQNALGN